MSDEIDEIDREVRRIIREVWSECVEADPEEAAATMDRLPEEAEALRRVLAMGDE